MGRSDVVGLHQEWVNKYLLEARRIRSQYNLDHETLKRSLFEFSAREIENALRPMASVDGDELVGAMIGYSLFSFIPLIGTRVCSWLDKRSFASDLRKRIGIHHKGSETANYVFCSAGTGAASGGFSSHVYDLSNDDGDFLEGLLEGVVDSYVPFVGAVMRTANLKNERTDLVNAAIERGTLLHQHWISARLDYLLVS